ncbi:MAG: hypothetical protein ACMUIP_14910 [bacterium]
MNAILNINNFTEKQIEDINQFFDLIKPNKGLIETFYKKNFKKPVTKFYTKYNKQQFLKDVINYNTQGYTCYAGLQPRREDLKKSGKNEDIISLRFLYMDLDSISPKLRNATDAEKKLTFDMATHIQGVLTDCLDYQEPYLVDSGNGYWLIMSIPEIGITNGNREETKAKLKEWGQRMKNKFKNLKIDFDVSVYDLRRVTKIPGTKIFNKPDEPGRPQRISEIISLDPPNEDQKLREDFLSIEIPSAHICNNPPSEELSPKEGLDKMIENCDFIQYARNNQKNLSEPLWKNMISNICRFQGGREKIHEFSKEYPGYKPEETDKKIDHLFKSSPPITCKTIKKDGYGCKKTCKVKSPAGLGVIEQPKEDEVVIKSGKLPFAIDKAEEIFLKKNPHSIFQRSGQLVKITPIDQKKEESGIIRNSGTPIITPIDAHYVVELFTRSAKFFKYNKYNKLYRVDPAVKIGITYISRSGEWKVPVLKKIIECPTIKADGTILDKPGYDKESSLYFFQGGTKFKKIKANPTKDDAMLALNILKRPFKDFPFVTEADESVALVAVLTGAIRQSLRTAPLFAFTAPAPSSGKSLLTEAIGLIITGRVPPSMNQAKDPHEESKKLLALLLAGDPIILIDNCEHPISGETLCTILSQESYKGRILGASKMGEASTAVTIMASGNNLRFKGDMSARALLCTIDPGVEHPEEREFDVNLYEHIPLNRAIYVNAALTILKAYIDAGRPKQNSIKPWSKYQEWSDKVRSALIWLEQEDPYKSHYKIEADDPIQEQFTRFLHQWWVCLADREITLKNAFDVNYMTKLKMDSGNCPQEDTTNHQVLCDIAREISDDRFGPDAEINLRKIAAYLMKYENKIAGGLKIQRVKTSGKNTNKWKVTKAPIV